MKVNVTVILFSLLLAPLLGDSIHLGLEDEWKEASFRGSALKKGLKGYSDIVIAHQEYIADDETLLLLNFNNLSEKDETENYTITIQKEGYAFDKSWLGRGIGQFNDRGGIILKRDREGPYEEPPGSFTIDFWLKPSQLFNGEVIFYWNAFKKDYKGDLIQQSIMCRVEERRIKWKFNNLFYNGETFIEQVTTQSQPLIPGVWRRHMIRYDGTYGLLEQLVDGVPTDITYTTSTGFEEGEQYQLAMGNQLSNILVGLRYNGFIDEFRISSIFRETMTTDRFLEKGSAILPIINLEIPKTFISEIEPITEIHGSSQIKFYYIISNDFFEAEQYKTLFDHPKWQPLETIRLPIQGQYLLIKADFYKDIEKDESPVLSELKVSYKPSQMPPTPLSVKAVEGKRSVTLSWDISYHPNLGGYKIYMGTNPGVYLHYQSPIDVGLSGEYTVYNLEPNRIYFFIVVPYAKTDSRLTGESSEEVTAIPNP